MLPKRRYSSMQMIYALRVVYFKSHMCTSQIKVAGKKTAMSLLSEKMYSYENCLLYISGNKESSWSICPQKNKILLKSNHTFIWAKQGNLNIYRNFLNIKFWKMFSKFFCPRQNLWHQFKFGSYVICAHM